MNTIAHFAGGPVDGRIEVVPTDVDYRPVIVQEPLEIGIALNGGPVWHPITEIIYHRDEESLRIDEHGAEHYTYRPDVVVVRRRC